MNKASGNVAIICKKNYALTVMMELGVTISDSNDKKTHEMINTTNKNNTIPKDTRLSNRYRL